MQRPLWSTSRAGLCRHVWVYDDEEGIKIELGRRMQGIPRMETNEVKQLINSGDPLAVPCNPDRFYTAQLLHYGMLPVGNAAASIAALKAEFAKPYNRDDGLKVPASILAVEDALKCEYEERMNRKEARQAELQKELDAVEAVKRKEAQLRLELEALGPSVSRRKPQAANLSAQNRANGNETESPASQPTSPRRKRIRRIPSYSTDEEDAGE